MKAESSFEDTTAYLLRGRVVLHSFFNNFYASCSKRYPLQMVFIIRTILL